MKAIIMTAGDAQSYGNFFVAGWEYLSGQLELLGIEAIRGPALSDDVGRCMEQLRDATEAHPLMIILTSPQPRTAAIISAVMAKGLGLSLQKSSTAEECILYHAAKLGVGLSPEDLSAFSMIPKGAVTLKNLSGFFQGYAISARKQLLLALPATPSELQHCYSSHVGDLIARFVASRQPAPPAPTAMTTPPPVKLSQRPMREATPPSKTQADSVVEVCRVLEQEGLTVATAESGTTGALAQTLGSCQSRAFSPNAAFSGREQLGELDIPEGLLAQYGTISPQAATALALAARSRAGTHLGVAITMGTPQGGTGAAAYLAVTDGQRVWRKSAESKAPGSQQLRLGAVLGALGILNMYATGNGLPEGTPVGQELAAPAPAGIKGKFMGMMNQTSRRTPSEGSEPQEMAKKTNLLQRLRAGRTTRNDKIRLAAVVLFLGIFVSSMVYIGSVYQEAGNNITLSDDLRGLMGSDTIPASLKGKYPKDYLTKFAALYEQNHDVAGWVKIPDTKVDYVSVQGGDNLYYERRDFTRKDNQHGVVFVDYRVDQEQPSKNTVLYAHNMDDGQMFGELMGYKSLSYYKQHPMVEYDSVYREADYKIFGVVICKMNDPEFNYHNYIDMDDKTMTDYVTKIRERSIINTGVDVRTDDELLTLSTCDYTFKSATGENIARFAVFARKVRKGESPEVDTSKAVVNPNPVIPQEWKDKIARQQAEAEKKKLEEASASSSSAVSAAGTKKWLYDYELSDLSVEEQQEVVARRQSEAKKYLTTDEQSSLTLDDMLTLIGERQDLFSLFLTENEQSISISRRLSMSKERRALALEWLTGDEIRAAGSWSHIEALIKERQTGGTVGQVTNSKYLTTAENKDTTIPKADKDALIAQRQKLAQDAGLTPAEINSCADWTAMEQLIASKGGSASNDVKIFIRDNPKWLMADENYLTIDELRSLVASRKQAATTAGIDTSKYNSWSAMSTAIDNAMASKKQTLMNSNKPYVDAGDANQSYADLTNLINTRKAEAAKVLSPAEIAASPNWAHTNTLIQQKLAAGAGDKAKKEFLAANSKWISPGEVDQTLQALTAMVTDRKAKAKAANVDTSAMTSWAQIEQAIANAASKPPVVPPVDPPVTPPDSSSGSSTPPVPESPASTPNPPTPPPTSPAVPGVSP